MRAVLKDSLTELSEHLGRSVDNLRQRGLQAEDFLSNQTVHLEFDDGSQATFNDAFFVLSASRDEVAVFTEHCGYHVFSAAGLEVSTAPS